MNFIKKTIISIFLVAISIFTVLIAPINAFATSLPSYANLEKTDVLEDLMTSTVNGESFKIENYPYDVNKGAQLITFVEFCYSYKPEMQGDYGLYVYIYNPKGTSIATSGRNTIQMAIFDSNGKAVDYHKFALEYIDHVATGDYKNLFYKFRVVDEKVNGTTFLERVNTNVRKYEISGFEIERENGTIEDNKVSKSFNFKGFASGYGPDEAAECTLSCEAGSSEVIELSVNHTYYRTKSGILENHQNQIETVYFSVPKRYIEQYGSLQKIKAEWYEYKTQPIIVTDNGNFYNAVTYNDQIGVWKAPQHDSSVSWGGKSYGVFSGDPNVDSWGNITYYSRVGWNINDQHPIEVNDTWNYLFYLFLAENIESYDPRSDITGIGGVTSNVLYDYIKSYNKTSMFGTLPIKNGTVSADLFISGIDSNRYYNDGSNIIQQGKCTYNFDAEIDIHEVKNWSQNDLSFKDAWSKYGFWQALSGNRVEYEDKTFAPIQILKETDLTGSDEAISNNLAVNIQDVGKIRAAYQDAVTIDSSEDEERVLVLFRFAVTDYYSEPLYIAEFDGSKVKCDNTHAYIAQETVFLDFDIIQLTFKKDEEWTVIPVVMDPMDIVADITPPTDMPKDWEDIKKDLEDWLEKIKEIAKKVIAVVLICLIVAVLFPILMPIFNVIIKILTLPFKLILKRSRKRK